jgi:hypothetical protein
MGRGRNIGGEIVREEMIREEMTREEMTREELTPNIKIDIFFPKPLDYVYVSL